MFAKMCGCGAVKLRTAERRQRTGRRAEPKAKTTWKQRYDEISAKQAGRMKKEYLEVGRQHLMQNWNDGPALYNGIVLRIMPLRMAKLRIVPSSRGDS